MTLRRIENAILTLIALIAALCWIFPVYWAFLTSIRSEANVIARAGLLPREFNISAYVDALTKTKILTWYANSVGTAIIVTLVVLVISMMCAYALSQISFPGRKLLYFTVLASFMIPAQALVVTQFILMNDMGLINSWGGIILPQLIAPVTVIVYKQFFDAVPKELREAVIIDGGGEYTLLFKIYLPLNWGVTAALGIITFVGVWNAFFWPFLVVTSEDMMTIPVGITQVSDAFGVAYAREMSVAMLAAIPVIAAYLIFQRRVTEAVIVSSGIKG